MYHLYGHIQLNDLMMVTFAPKKNAFKLAWWRIPCIRLLYCVLAWCHVHVPCIRLLYCVLAWCPVHVPCIRLYEFVILRPAMSHSMVVAEHKHSNLVMQLRITKIYIRWAYNINTTQKYAPPPP